MSEHKECPFCKTKIIPLTKKQNDELKSCGLQEFDIKTLSDTNEVFPANIYICPNCFYMALFHAMPEKITKMDEIVKITD